MLGSDDMTVLCVCSKLLSTSIQAEVCTKGAKPGLRRETKVEGWRSVVNHVLTAAVHRYLHPVRPLLQEVTQKRCRLGTRSGKGTAQGSLFRTIGKPHPDDCNVSSIYTVNSRDHMVGDRVKDDPVLRPISCLISCLIKPRLALREDPDLGNLSSILHCKRYSELYRDMNDLRANFESQGERWSWQRSIV